jgi:hypothetical protein
MTIDRTCPTCAKCLLSIRSAPFVASVRREYAVAVARKSLLQHTCDATVICNQQDVHVSLTALSMKRS